MKKYLLSLAAGLLLVSLAIATGYSNDVSYTYDQLNRLIAVEYLDGTRIEYTYDDLGNRITQNVFISSNPVANFTLSPTTGTAPLTVSFTDQSTGSIGSRSWSFGDGGNSTSQNPVYTYNNAGTYTVLLTVSNGVSSSSQSKTITVSHPIPVANFIASPTSGTVPLAVSFTDCSSGDITGWSWSFGDGGTSTIQNPGHTYTNPGTYTVTLTASGPGGNSNLATTSITVALPPPVPVANFSATPTSGIAPLTVQFTDASSGSVTSWSWAFGDGGTSTSQNPSHTYSTLGSYTVSLTATGPGGSNTNTQTNLITTTAPTIPGIDQYTKLLLHGDGANGGTTVTDSSGNNNNPSVVNAVVTSTALSKFGGSSLSFIKASSSYLGFAENANWHISSGADFTYDFWVFPRSMPAYGLGVCGTMNPNNGGTGIALLGSHYGDNGQIAIYTNGGWQAVSSGAVPLNAWTHIAVVRYQGVVSIYINGVQSGTKYSGLCTDSTSGFSTGDIYPQGVNLSYWGFDGYIDEFRFSNGVARWTTNFTPPTYEYGTSAPGANFSASVTSGTAPLNVQFTDTSTGTVTGWSWTFGDGGTSTSQNPNYTYSTPGTYTVSLTATGPNGSNTNTQTNCINVSTQPQPIPGIDQYTELMLHGEGVNGGTTITDSSFNDYTPSTVTGVVTSTAHKMFGAASLLYNGQGYLSYPASANWSLAGGQDFTIDAWVFPLSMPAYGLGICGTMNPNNGGTGIALRGTHYGNNGQVALFTNGGWQAVSSAAVPLNAWTHIAVVRYKGVVSIYINGQQSGTKYSGSCTDSTSGFSTGDIYPQGVNLSYWGFNGYIDEFRFSNGVARWTTNFTPPNSSYD